MSMHSKTKGGIPFTAGEAPDDVAEPAEVSNLFETSAPGDRTPSMVPVVPRRRGGAEVPFVSSESTSQRIAPSNKGGESDVKAGAVPVKKTVVSSELRTTENPDLESTMQPSKGRVATVPVNPDGRNFGGGDTADSLSMTPSIRQGPPQGTVSSSATGSFAADTRVAQAYVVPTSSHFTDPELSGALRVEQESLKVIGDDGGGNQGCLECEVNCSRRTFIIGLVLLLVIGGIIAAVVALTRDPSPSPQTIPTLAPTSITPSPVTLDPTAPDLTTPAPATLTLPPKKESPTNEPTTPRPTTAFPTQAPTTASPTLSPTPLMYDDQNYNGTDKWVRVDPPSDFPLRGNAGEEFGNFIAVSRDGTTIAVGNMNSEEGGLASGYVRVFRVAEDGNGTSRLRPLGEPLYGAPGDFLGGEIAISENGLRLAVGGNWPDFGQGGRVYFYEHDGFDWRMLGTIDAPRDDLSSLFGSSLAMSDNGSIVAVSDTLYDNGRGLVQVFRLQEDDSSFVQMGQDLLGVENGDQFGFELAMTEDGLTLVVSANQFRNATGMVRVFQWTDPLWEPVGQELLGQDLNHFFGESVSISADGSVLAIGEPGYFAGGIGIFTGRVQFLGLSSSTGEWEDVATPLIGENRLDLFGYEVDLSNDGQTCAIGILWRDSSWNETGCCYGRVLVYQYDGSSEWVQKGQWTEGSHADDNYGTNLAISGDGNVLVASAPGNDANGEDSGEVRVYLQQEGVGSPSPITWEPVGQTLRGGSNSDQFGFSLSMSDDGMEIAVGALVDGGDGRGYVEVHQFEDRQWVPKGSRISSRFQGSRFGYSVSISGDASSLLVGAALSDIAGIRSGEVLHYEYEDDSEWVETMQFNGSHPNEWLGLAVDISNDGLIFAAGAWRSQLGGFQSGTLYAYQRESMSSPWVPLGSPIYGKDVGHNFGSSVALTGDGMMVAGFAMNATTDKGYVTTYSYDGTDWVQVGQVLGGFESKVITYPIKIALNMDGTIMAVGSYTSVDANATVSGSVRAYRLSKDRKVWTQIGDTLYGWTVDLSSDGLTLAVGAYFHEISGRDEGLVRVFGWDGLNWRQLGEDLLGQEIGESFGYSIGLSGDGMIVAGGAVLGNLGGTDVGNVRVFRQVAAT